MPFYFRTSEKNRSFWAAATFRLEKLLGNAVPCKPQRIDNIFNTSVICQRLKQGRGGKKAADTVGGVAYENI
jgi:hypothetical protein